MGVTLKKERKAEKPDTGVINKLTGLLSKDISLSRGFSDKDKEAFYQYMTTLAGSGIQLPVALQLFSEEELAVRTKAIAKDLHSHVINGMVLSKAMKETGHFEPYEYYNIQIGEETGRITDVLKGLKNFYENKLKQSRKIKSVLAYPVIVLTVSVLAMWFLMSYIVPLFSDIYKRFGGELPWVTQLVLNISNLVGSYYWVFLIVVTALIIVRKSISKSEAYRRISSMILLRLPGIGELVRKTYVSRFCHSMALMMKSNIPFIRALDITGKMVDFYPIDKVMPTLANDILKGEQVYTAFSKVPIFDKQMITLLKVGQEVNKLDEMFETLGKNYDESLDHNISVINTVLEPLIIVFLGLVIGFILVAMYLPLFNMGNQMVQ